MSPHTHTVAYIIIPYRKYMALDDVNIYYSGNICCVVGCNRFDARQARSWTEAAAPGPGQIRDWMLLLILADVDIARVFGLIFFL